MALRKKSFLFFEKFRSTNYYNSVMYPSYVRADFKLLIEKYAIAIATLSDWLKRTCASFSANEEKNPKPIAVCRRDFSPTLGKLQFAGVNSNWFTAQITKYEEDVWALSLRQSEQPKPAALETSALCFFFFFFPVVIFPLSTHLIPNCCHCSRWLRGRKVCYLSKCFTVKLIVVL